ncbi:lipolpqB domain protein [Mycobacterium xenopi 3993]|nr:lipolpqB domain protein [Mycobacterium xenopi 3993]
MRDAPVGGAADVGSGSCRMCVRAEFISAASHRHRRATGAVEPAQADPGMDPDVLLREFLKATADPANRHLAARQFLTQSASNAWDDAGSALLIDHVVFVETRTAERFQLPCGLTSWVRCPTWGCSRPPRECCRIPDRSSWSKLPGLAHRPAAERGVFGLAAVPGDLQAQRAVFRRPDRQDGGARSALRRRLRSRPAGHRAGLQTDRRTTPEMSRSVRNLLAPPLRLRGPVTRADGGKTGVGRGYGGAR